MRQVDNVLHEPGKQPRGVYLPVPCSMSTREREAHESTERGAFMPEKFPAHQDQSQAEGKHGINSRGLTCVIWRCKGWDTKAEKFLNLSNL